MNFKQKQFIVGVSIGIFLILLGIMLLIFINNTVSLMIGGFSIGFGLGFISQMYNKFCKEKQ